MNKESYLIHSNTVRKVLKENFGFTDVSIVKAEKRLHGLNYLVDVAGALYYVKCTSYLNDDLYVLLSSVFSELSSGELYAPKLVKPTKSPVNFMLDDVTYYVQVTAYINGLTRYKDVLLSHLKIDVPSNITNLHKRLEKVNDVFAGTLCTNQTFISRSDFVQANFSNVAELNHLDFDTLHSYLRSYYSMAPKTVVHGNLGQNIFLDQNMRTVVLDFDDIHFGVALEDVSRLLATLDSKDLPVIDALFETKLSAEDYSALTGFIVYSMIYEVVECQINFAAFAELVGQEETGLWFQRKLLKLNEYLKFKKGLYEKS